MADKKMVQDMDSSEAVVAKAKDFWTRYSKAIIIVCAVIIVAVGGWYIYQNMIKGPKESKAAEAMFKAEEYYRLDSVNLALNGDGQYPGFLRIISQYGGTDASNLANFYAGSCYIKLNDNQKALKYLKNFSSSSKPVQARAYKLMADAYGDLGQNADALTYYKKAGHHFEKDENNSADALLMAGYLSDRVLKNQKEAIEIFKEIVQKFPLSNSAREADMYLAQMGVYSTDN